MAEECSICGLDLTDKFIHELKCNHIFHYECLLKTFANIPMKMNDHNSLTRCPYCRSKCDYLPLVNGLKRVVPGAHCKSRDSFPKNILKQNYNAPCKFILTRGKNKGNECGKNCFLGYEYCKTHENKNLIH